MHTTTGVVHRGPTLSLSLAVLILLRREFAGRDLGATADGRKISTARDRTSGFPTFQALSLAVADYFGGQDYPEKFADFPYANDDFASGREVVSTDLRANRLRNVGGLSSRRVRYGKRSLTGCRDKADDLRLVAELYLDAGVRPGSKRLNA